MRKNVFGRRLKRDKNERKALFKGLLSSLVLTGRIKTTEEKAKAIKGEIDKVVNRGKKDSLMARRLLSKHLTPDAVKKLISEVIPQLNKRTSGYTRIIRLGKRLSDNAVLVVLEWVDEIKKPEPKTQEVKKEKIEKKKVKK